MTASRPYRDGMPRERALVILRDDAGNGVDADRLTAFERFLDSDDGRTLMREAKPEGDA